MLKTDYHSKVEEIMSNHFSEFDSVEEIEILSITADSCIVRTYNLTPTLFHMQQMGWHLRDLTPDDTEVSWVKIECNILSYYK